MNTPVRSLAAVAAGLCFQSACSSIGVAPVANGAAAARVSSATGPTVYAFSPERSLIASYLSDGFVRTKPASVIKGSNTRLSAGNGVAVDTDGTTYVTVYGGGSSGYVKLLVFPPGASGNVSPARTALLGGHLIPGHAVGLALDGHGNFWLSAIGKLLRFPTSAHGRTRPNDSITLQLETPWGVKMANASNVALDPAGNVYCACAVVFQGMEVAGISEYAVAHRRKPKEVRSFYDTGLPEVPPGSVAVDPVGTIYLASPLRNSWVYAYDAATKSGASHSTRRFRPATDTVVSSMATDASGNVYIAAGSRVMVFGPDTKGQVHPVRSIVDRRRLLYTTDDYGTLLSIR